MIIMFFIGACCGIIVAAILRYCNDEPCPVCKCKNLPDMKSEVRDGRHN